MRGREALVGVVAGAVVVTGGAMVAPAADAAPSAGSALRIGVLALVGSVAAVGQTPELSTPLPFTLTSPAEVLDLERNLTSNLTQALQGTDLRTALGRVEGIRVLDDGDGDEDTLSFVYASTVTTALELAHDDGDLRFGANEGAGSVTVGLTTRDEAPFKVAVDPDETDPLLRVALVSQPLLDLSIDIDTEEVAPFTARQGFTDVQVAGGTYRAHREQVITMRDPEGRGVLTLEDLRYSTLPDLFRVTTQDEDLDVSFDLELPDSVAGGSQEGRRGTLSLGDDELAAAEVWPTATDATRAYGDQLAQATGLSMVDGLTSLAQYTGSVLALQDAAEVPFPNLDGGTSDVFAPGDDLLDLLATAAAAQVVCGPSPTDPPTGVATPGDAVYCQATTAEGLGAVTGVTWTLEDDEGGRADLDPVAAVDEATVGQDPTGLVKVTGTDGEPDVAVSFTAGDEPLTARSMPRTVQDVLGRIREIGGSSASAELVEGRLDVAVGIEKDTSSAQLPVGNPGTLGALVGLTGLRSPNPDEPATTTATGTGASFDVGFGIATDEPATGRERATWLLPRDASLLAVDDVSAAAPDGLEGLPARIGFLSVTADVDDLDLGRTGTDPAVTLDRVVATGADPTDPLLIDDLFADDGTLDPDLLRLASTVRASIRLSATEQPVSGSTYATGDDGPASGTTSVVWGSTGVPQVTEDAGYAPLRVFDPVPARFLSGTARVSGDGVGGTSLEVTSLPDGQSLYEALNVAAPTAGGQPVEVQRRLLSDGLGCQSVTLLDADTLTCEGLTPAGETTWVDGEPAQVVVLGDPFALRDSVIDGLASTIAGLDRTAADNVDEPAGEPALAADQYTATLPLVGLTPAQLAVERVALREGLTRMDAAAQEDEAGRSATPVSTAQDLVASVPDLVKVAGSPGDFEPRLDLVLGDDQLDIELLASAPTTPATPTSPERPTVLRAPLRLDDLGTTDTPGRGQVSSGTDAADKAATVPVSVDSTTTLAISVDRVTARSATAEAAGTTSVATADLGDTELDGHPLDAGVASLVAGAGSTADLGVRVRTSYAETADGGQFETRRDNAPDTAGPAAAAELVVGPDDTISYTAAATDSAGGEGAEQPAPDPMQVKYLAEGLDGLAVALGSAMDGAAPRNLDPETGIPVSAPLIGTDLDAGAGVAEQLTRLTSSLRDELRTAAVTGAADAVTLAGLLDDAVANAVADFPDDLASIDAADVEVLVTCGDDEVCEPCPAPAARALTAPPSETTTEPSTDPVAAAEPSTDPSSDASAEPSADPSADTSSEPSAEPTTDADDASTAQQRTAVTEESTTSSDPGSDPGTVPAASGTPSADTSTDADPDPSGPAEATEDPSDEPTTDPGLEQATEPGAGARAADPDAAAAAAAAVCTTDGPTGWDTVSISTTLEGLESDGKVAFETGLAGLEVRSDAEIDTTTSWTLPITLELKRGVGPRVVVDGADQLDLDVSASLPADGIPAIVGYLPATLSSTGTTGEEVGRERDGAIDTTVVIDPAADTYDLFQLYAGELTARPSFAEDPDQVPADPTDDESGLLLGFETQSDETGTLGLSGEITVPWTAEETFTDEVTYDDVRLDLGPIVAGIATPFQIVDPYLAPIRDVVDVLRSPIPVVSDLSELGGGDEVSLLSLLETLSQATKKPQLELAHRVVGLVGGATDVISDIAPLADEEVLLDDVAGAAGSLLTIDPSDVALYEKCTEAITTTTTQAGGATTVAKKAPAPCDSDEDEAADGAAGQTAEQNRTGTRRVSERVDTKTRDITGQLPGFSLPFLADPDQIMDVLTGAGEASYFRIDLGTLAAQVAYKASFGPIMAGPIPIKPFVGGSITLEGRLAMGFDSLPQTRAAQAVDPGDTGALVEAYEEFDGGVIGEGFYLDDLDAEGVDVPEVKLVTTLEAGAGISIGIVTAGLKGSVTLAINLNINDPNDDGRLRTAEINTILDGDAACAFDAKGTIEAAIAVFVEIELLFTSLEYEYNILELGPYTLFEYGCPDVVPTLAVENPGEGLLLTSGNQNAARRDARGDVADEYEVRQFDGDDGTRYELSGFGRIQNVEVEPEAGKWRVTIFESGIATSTKVEKTFTTDAPPTFEADGGTGDDQLAFLRGEEFTADETGELTLVSTAFTTPVTALTGGAGNDALTTGDGDDRGIDGGLGADAIDLGPGDDSATGGAGSDIVEGGAGQDDVRGGTDGDRLQGGPGADRVNGEAGDDSLVGGSGRDVRALLVQPRGPDGPAEVTAQVSAGFDSGDVVVGGPGVDSVDGGDGSDVVVGGAEPDLTDVGIGTLFGPGTRDYDVLVQGATDADAVSEVTRSVATTTALVPSDASLDSLCVSGEPATGAGEQDFVTGGAEKDVVIGGDGADVLDGGAGPDEICGRAGDDDISGDTVVVPELDADGVPVPRDGALDRDVVRGGTGDDRVDGGPGDDVVFGDDVTLLRDGTRALDGSLGAGAGEGGEDYLDGNVGDDVLAGGPGADLLVGAAGDDATFGEGLDTPAADGATPSLQQRLLACNPVTRVVRGRVDLDGDLLAGAGGDGLAADTGMLAGLDVVDGVLQAPGSGLFTGQIGGETSVVDGLVDLDRDGVVVAEPDAVDPGDQGDTGIVERASMIQDPANPQGDCVLAGEGDDRLGGGAGSDYLGAGDGTDLAEGGDGNDLLLGDDGTDVLRGGPHQDVLVGGLGDDGLAGGNGDDRLRGNEGDDDLVGGSETAGATDGQDVLLGGDGQDVLAAENGVAVSGPVVAAVATAPWALPGTAPEAVLATTGSPLVFGSSALGCTTQAAARWLTTLPDDGDPGVALASPGTDPAYDELYGGDDCDVVLGSPGDDLVRGGAGDDLVEAGPGTDVAQGDDGDDVVVGGSSFDPRARTPFTTDRSGAGVPDARDTVLGDGGPDAADGADLLAGDNALATRIATSPGGATGVGPAFVLRLHDLATTSATPDPDASGPDDLVGGGADDRLFGQGGDDVQSGDAGQDYLEGNDGGDRLSGGTGDDDLLGGSSAADGRPLGATGARLSEALGGPFDASAAGLLDGGTDVVDAGTGDDVVLGDNGRLTRPDPLVRDLARADESGTAGVSGDDSIAGGDGADRLLGQGGVDTIDAGAEEDHVEGNEGGDLLTGGLGADTVVGGSSLSPDGDGSLDDAVRDARAQLDGSDTIWGDQAGPGAVSSDLLVGDNATVLRDGALRAVQLADVATTTTTPAPLTSGGDVILGGEAGPGLAPAGDVVLGQGGGDTVRTGAGDDYVEGAAGNDSVDSGAGDDDVLGGASALDGRPLGTTGTRLTGDGTERPDASGPRLLDGADTLLSGAGDDVVLGDNGLLTRPSGAGTTTRADGTRLRTVLLHDVATATVTVPSVVGGADVISAGDGADLVFGQLGDDTAAGDTGGDYLEGNAGSDTLGGGADEDDLVGGGSSTSGEVLSVSGTRVEDRLLTPVTAATDPSGAGQVDGNDVLDGGDARDVLLGDNGRITRDGPHRTLAGGASGTHVVRQVAMADDAPGVWAGSDQLYGGLGDDDLYGQFDSTLTRRAQQTFEGQRVPGDVLDGGTGDDALLGDQGVDVPTPAAALGAPDRTVSDRARFIRELVRPAGTLVRVVTLSQSTVGGNDVLLGGSGQDSLHAGAGKDLSNAGSGEDVVFAGDGSDGLWGGTGHDRLFGGAGSDVLDIKKRARDPRLWHAVAPVEDTDRRRVTRNGRDLLYGGAGADGLQADQGGEGTRRRLQGDRLIDWRGPINHYEVCRSGFGPGLVLDKANPSIIAALRQVAAATGSVGSSELAVPGLERLVRYRDGRRFVCETR